MRDTVNESTTAPRKVRNHKPIFVAVFTEFADTGKLEKKRIIDHANPKDRAWLGKHAYWAIRNNRALLTVPTDSATNFPVDYDE